MLPNERQRITDVGSLMIMDVLVEFETGELADVEIQKIGCRFPGQRASCYSSDMVMRQYERVKGIKGLSALTTLYSSTATAGLNLT